MSSKKHIAICSTSYYEYDRRLQRIADALISEGYQITWISRQQSAKAKPISGLTHYLIDTHFKSGPLFYLEYNWRILKALRQIKPDYINAIDLDTIPGCSAAKGSTQKLIFDAHEIYYEVPELINKPLKKAIWKAAARHYLPALKLSYTVNSSLKDHYEAKYKTSYEVIRNIGLITQQARDEYANNKTLVYLGVLNIGRGIEIAIEAVRRRPDYTLLLIGEGDESQALRAQAAGLANVKFWGYAQPSEINGLLREAAIGINMLKAESLNYKLSLANKFFDYMHVGLPSINMDYPEYASIIKKNKVGLLVKEYSVEGLLQALTTLENEGLYLELTQNAIAAREEYNWDIEKKKLLRFYNEVSAE